jgi:hypothetical protein
MSLYNDFTYFKWMFYYRNPRVSCKSRILPRLDLTKWRDASSQLPLSKLVSWNIWTTFYFVHHWLLHKLVCVISVGTYTINSFIGFCIHVWEVTGYVEEYRFYRRVRLMLPSMSFHVVPTYQIGQCHQLYKYR